MMTKFYTGEPIMSDYTPASAVSAGDVVIVGDLALIAHLDIAASKLGAIALRNGVYAMTADGAIGAMKRVYWDATNSKVTLTASGNRLIGFNLVATTTDGDTAYVLHSPAATFDLIFAEVAAATAVANTAAETAFDQSVTIPASTLAAGDVIRVRAQGIATATHTTDTLTIKLYIGTTAVIVTAAVDVADNDIFYIEADIVIRTAGASGTLVAAGVEALGAAGTATARPQFKASTAVDTTASQAIAVKATWSAADAGNSVRMDVLNVQVIRK